MSGTQPEAQYHPQLSTTNQPESPHGWPWMRAVLLSVGVVLLTIGAAYVVHESNEYEAGESNDAFPSSMQSVGR